MNPSFATAFKSRLPLPLNNLSRHGCNVWKGLAVQLMRLGAHFSRQTLQPQHPGHRDLAHV
jgi:hypothetical protein